jgi:ankyrin repeat protein
MAYFPNGKGLVMLHVDPGKDELEAKAAITPGAVAGRTLSSCIPDHKIDATAIWYLMRNGFAGELERLKGEIARRPVEEQITLLTGKNARGYPGLFMALRDGHAGVVEIYGELLKLIPVVEQCVEPLAAKTDNGHSALFLALKNRHVEAVDAYVKQLRWLPEKLHAKVFAATVRHVGIDGKTAAMHAAANGQTEILKLLIANKAQIEDKDEDGMTALMHAAANGHTEAVQFLIDKKADLDARTGNRSTALMLAAGSGHLEVVELLIRKEANTDARNLYGQSAVTLARNGGHIKVKNRLKEERKFPFGFDRK